MASVAPTPRTIRAYRYLLDTQARYDQTPHDAIARIWPHIPPDQTAALAALLFQGLNTTRTQLQEARAEIARLTTRPVVDPDLVIDRVLTLWRVDHDDIKSYRRTRRVVAARRTVCVALRHAGLSYQAIGRIIGRDHTTVMHAVTTATPHDETKATQALQSLGLAS